MHVKLVWMNKVVIMTHAVNNTRHASSTDRTIIDNKYIFYVCRQVIERAAIEHQTRVEAENLSKIISDTQNISDKVGVEHVNGIVEKALINALVIKSLQPIKSMSTL